MKTFQYYKIENIFVKRLELLLVMSKFQPHQHNTSAAPLVFAITDCGCRFPLYAWSIEPRSTCIQGALLLRTLGLVIVGLIVRRITEIGLV